MAIRLKVDDRVHWISQSGGFVKVKEGVVAAIVPKGSIPANIPWKDIGPYGASLGRLGTTNRDHVSYLIRVRHSTYYWPLVAHLRRGRAPKAKIQESPLQDAIKHLEILHRTHKNRISVAQREALELAITTMKEKL